MADLSRSVDLMTLKFFLNIAYAILIVMGIGGYILYRRSRQRKIKMENVEDIKKIESLNRYPRSVSKEEARFLFLKHMASLVNFWEKTPLENSNRSDIRHRLEGLLHSILVTLDGGSCGMPGYYLVPSVNESDVPYAKKEGCDYYPHAKDLEKILEDIGSYDLGAALHEHMYPVMRGEMKLPENSEGLYTFSDLLADEAKKFA